jgi:transposase
VADGWLSEKAEEGLDARQREGLLRDLRERGFRTMGEAVRWCEERLGVKVSIDQMRLLFQKWV